jgi:hypothetical protein
VKRSSSARYSCAGVRFERVIGGIAEEIVEERLHRASQVDAAGPRQQADLPDDGHGHVEERLLALAGVEVRRCRASQRPLALAWNRRACVSATAPGTSATTA